MLPFFQLNFLNFEVHWPICPLSDRSVALGLIGCCTCQLAGCESQQGRVVGQN